ncbi:hypothetical protein A0H81_07852 [Grifola frondosa]|uniref:Uncharacterized protein n=1 Tax=Grifola frondosa TaxID=5627 RepID=A0A1C7MBU2_GRIFR|nr:hypothetical protein A0H81_07852 [Grifola frondosa]
MNQELIHHSDVSGVVSEDTSINVGFDGHIEIAAPCTYVHSSLVNAVDSKESVEMSGAADSDMHSDTRRRWIPNWAAPIPIPTQL